MIEVEQLSDEQWLVTVRSKTTTQHRVRVTGDEVKRFGGDGADAKQLLAASFRFLLEREPNTSILREFELPVIERYFPEYSREVGRYIRESNAPH